MQFKTLNLSNFYSLQGFGSGKALGDADFYPNGGVDQPGCPAHVGNHIFTLITGQISGENSDLYILSWFSVWEK